MASIQSWKYQSRNLSRESLLHAIVRAGGRFSEPAPVPVLPSVRSSRPIAEKVQVTQPPIYIMGVGNTIGALKVAPDWFSLTFPLGFDQALLEKELKRQFPKFNPTPLGFGGKGYSKQIKFGPASLYYAGSDKMGLHVQFPGEAIRACFDLFDFLSFAVESGAFCTRFDIACDDHGLGVLDIARMTDTAKQDAQLGSFRRFKPFEEYTSRCKMLSHAVTFGSRTSEVYARIYNKNLEQIAKKVELENPEKEWIRLEFELKGNNSNASFQSYVDSGFKNLSSLLGRYCKRFLSFRVPSSTESNRSRWSVASWWSSFLDLLPSAEITLEKVATTIHKKAKWFAVSVAKSMAMLLKSPEYGVDWMHSLVIDATHKLTSADLLMISPCSDS